MSRQHTDESIKLITDALASAKERKLLLEFPDNGNTIAFVREEASILAEIRLLERLHSVMIFDNPNPAGDSQ